jgi:hypothetical protein
LIVPTVGRIVWYYPGQNEAIKYHRDQPLAAVVSYVWSDRMVNLAVYDADGFPQSRTSVPLLQDDDKAPDAAHCAWMPFQKDQAQRYAAREGDKVPGPPPVMADPHGTTAVTGVDPATAAAHGLQP